MDPPRRAVTGQIGAAALDEDVLLEIARFVEYLDALAVAVADVQKAVVAEHDAVHDAEKNAAGVRLGLLLRRLTAELPNVFALAVEDDDAPVAVAVGDVNVAVRRIDREACRPVEQRMARVQRGGFLAAVFGIEFTLRADLQQQLAVARILLRDGVGVAADPDISLGVEIAVVNAARDDLRIAP